MPYFTSDGDLRPPFDSTQWFLWLDIFAYFILNAQIVRLNRTKRPHVVAESFNNVNLHPDAPRPACIGAVFRNLFHCHRPAYSGDRQA